jgi:anti-sigma factor RsiW
MDHDGLREAAGLYALGALPADERLLFEQHLSTCDECQRELRALDSVVTILPYAVTQIDPPPALRARVLAAVGADAIQVAASAPMSPRRSFAMAPWLSAAALLVMALGLGAYSVSLRQRVGRLEALLREAMTRV